MTRSGALRRGLARLSSRFGGAAAPRLPTMSLYLEDALNASGVKIDREAQGGGPNSYLFGKDMVLFRYATRGELAEAAALKKAGGRVYYVIDDDLESIPGDETLPAGYRRRVAATLASAWERIWELADEAVVSSAALEAVARELGAGRVTRLDPFWEIPEAAPESGAPLRIGWLCSRAHAEDLASIREELLPVLESGREARFVLWAGRYLPKWLRGVAAVENRPALPWPEYRAGLAAEKFDVAIYPLLDTAVNRARSINKFLEHAVAGAATMTSPHAPFADRAEAGECVFAEAGEWRGGLERLLDDREFRMETAERARRRAREIAERARGQQVEFWRDRLPKLAD